MKKIIVLFLLVICITSCGSTKDIETKKEESKKEEKISSIDCSSAKEKVSDGAILIDVRTEQEFKSGTLDNAINIPVDSINDITSKVLDKDAVIIVFCQSGKRSATAATKLKDLGYKNIYDLGSINNCQK